MAASPAALARKAERKRQWARSPDRRARRNAQSQARADAKLADAWGHDERWLILTCPGCQGLFDVPRVGGTRHKLCPECR